MSFPNKSKRETCWNARDRFWDCLDANKVNPEDPIPQACLELKNVFESSCPDQWVKHFNRKRDYNVFKKQLELEEKASRK